jgi:GNAT superfamily N-acetyltransferase
MDGFRESGMDVSRESATRRAVRGRVAIRPFRASDSIEALTRLLHRAYGPLANLGLNCTAAFQGPEMTRQRVEHGHCLVALDGKALVGTILVNAEIPNTLGAQFGRPEVASLHQFAVAPQCQGRGVGSLLLSRAEEYVAGQGLAAIALDTAEPDPRRVAFFVRRGYRSIAPIQWSGKTYRSVIMSKELLGG